MPCLQRGHLRSFLGIFSYLPVSIARYVQPVLNHESELSYAQQFLSSQGMFEIDNYQGSLLELDSYLFCRSLIPSSVLSPLLKPNDFFGRILFTAVHFSSFLCNNAVNSLER